MLNDPSFDPNSFLDRVEKAFVKCQHAWAARDPRPIRPFVSDGVYERATLHLEEQRALGHLGYEIVELELETIGLLGTSSSDLFDTVHVEIRAVAIIDSSGRRRRWWSVLSGQREKRIAEVWSFLRKRGARTRSGRPGLMEGNCPNCGATIGLSQSAKCSHCDALLRSAKYDWVLAEITERSEWIERPPTEATVAGLLQQVDPEFNVQHVEDRASVMFWRKSKTDRLGRLEPLARISTVECCRAYAKLMEARRRAADRHTYHGEPAVHAAHTVGVIPGEETDIALVEVRWSGQRIDVHPGERYHRRRESAFFRTLFVLGRRVRVRSDSDQVLSSAHCPRCGAPETGETFGAACEYCGAALNDGARDWILLETPLWAEPSAQRYLRQISRQNKSITGREQAIERRGVATLSSTGLTAWLLKMVLADGRIDPHERQLLQDVAERRNMSRQLLERMIDAARRGTLDVPEPRSREEAMVWIERMAQLALADGRIDPAEKQLMVALGSAVRYSAYDIQQVIRRVQVAAIRRRRG